MSESAAKAIARLREEIRHHDRKYYVEAAPEISDLDYDRLVGKLRSLEEAHPEVDVVNLRFTDLWKWVQALPGFADDPARSNEKILEAIQMAWLDERG